MKKLIIPVLVTGLIAASCSKKEAKAETQEMMPQDTLMTEQMDGAKEMMTEEKVNISGTFEGTIPCADCPGIETKLMLNDQDKSFTLESNYLEKKDGKFTEKGTFEVSEDGAFVTLKETKQVFHITADAAYLVESMDNKDLKQDYKLVRK